MKRENKQKTPSPKDEISREREKKSAGHAAEGHGDHSVACLPADGAVFGIAGYSFGGNFKEAARKVSFYPEGADFSKITEKQIRDLQQKLSAYFRPTQAKKGA